MSDSTFIASDLNVSGLLDASGHLVVIEGSFVGELVAGEVHITEKGVCEADITVSVATIEGQFAGVLRADTLKIGDQAKVGGELFTDELIIDSGADISGQICRKTSEVKR